MFNVWPRPETVPGQMLDANGVYHLSARCDTTALIVPGTSVLVDQVVVLRASCGHHTTANHAHRTGTLRIN